MNTMNINTIIIITNIIVIIVKPINLNNLLRIPADILETTYDTIPIISISDKVKSRVNNVNKNPTNPALHKYFSKFFNDIKIIICLDI